MIYDTEKKIIEYTKQFADKLYHIFPDKRLLDENSEMIGKIFEKTYNVKIKRSFGGYSYL
jgi:hemerythrin-like domain-containing protein